MPAQQTHTPYTASTFRDACRWLSTLTQSTQLSTSVATVGSASIRSAKTSSRKCARDAAVILDAAAPSSS
eukprot:6100645-Pleurochrysis_carterae.AAC.1